MRRTVLRVLETWPKDPLRPDAQLGAVLTARFEKYPTVPAGNAPSKDTGQLKAIKALLANQYKNKYTLPVPAVGNGEHQPPSSSSESASESAAAASWSAGILRPASNPEYYETLVRELDELPTRTTGERWWIRLKGLCRFS